MSEGVPVYSKIFVIKSRKEKMIRWRDCRIDEKYYVVCLETWVSLRHVHGNWN